MIEGPKGLPSNRPLPQRLVFRRLFYLQLVKIASQNLGVARKDRVFVSMMGGIGDLVNSFPSIEKLGQRYTVDMGTGPYPYRALVETHPHVRKVYAPFIYKPHRRGTRVLIERVLSCFYERVILLDNFGRDWWAQGCHISQIYAKKCDCPAPDKGVIYLSDGNRTEAAEYLRGAGLQHFIYVAQVIRYRRPFRSWPLAHYHELFRMLRERVPHPILVDTTGSDETAIPNFCTRLPRLDILTAAAVIDRALLFIGPDSGLTHIAAASGTPTVSIHLGYPPESCRALGDNVLLVRQQRPFDDPAQISPDQVFAVVKAGIRPS